MAAELAVNLKAATQHFVAAANQKLGHLETEVLCQTRELQRLTIEASAEAKADDRWPQARRRALGE